MSRTMVHIEYCTGWGEHLILDGGTATMAQYDLRKIREKIDPEWIPVQWITLYVGDKIALHFEYRTNTETEGPAYRDPAISMSLGQEWVRCLTAMRSHIARRLASSLLHQILEDTDNGGVWTEQDLREEGLNSDATKTRPGYWPRQELPLAKCLDLYDGAYGVGLIEHIPRYDTTNYHYVKYWLYDLEEVRPL